MKKPSENLRAAAIRVQRAFLNNFLGPRPVPTEAYAVDAQGNTTYAWLSDAVAWCMVGAVAAEYGGPIRNVEDGTRREGAFLRSALKADPDYQKFIEKNPRCTELAEFSDAHDAQTVARVLREAARLAKEAGQ